MPISATSSDWKALLSHLLVCARVCAIFNFYSTIYMGIPPEATSPTCCASLGSLCPPTHCSSSMLRTSPLKSSKMLEWDTHFSLAHFSSPCQFPPLLPQTMTQKEKLPERFVVSLQDVFIRLETATETISSTAQQWGGTEGTFSTLANSQNLYLYRGSLHLF